MINDQIMEGVDPATGEIVNRRMFGPQGDVRTAAWPPLSQGPLPVDHGITIGTALDEMDAWAIQYHRAETAVEAAREKYRRAKIVYELEAAKARRRARANPVERGRRTADDISAEVVEATHQPDGPYDRYLAAETELEVAITAYFAAAKQMDRCKVHIDGARRVERG